MCEVEMRYTSMPALKRPYRFAARNSLSASHRGGIRASRTTCGNVGPLDSREFVGQRRENGVCGQATGTPFVAARPISLVSGQNGPPKVRISGVPRRRTIPQPPSKPGTR